jgi:hypothetical protein
VISVFIGTTGCFDIARPINNLNNTGDESKPTNDDIVSGGWSDSRFPYSNEIDMFNRAMAEFSEEVFEPFLVASQTIGGGFNYTFLASSETVGANEEKTTIRVHIFYSGNTQELMEVWEVVPGENGSYTGSVMLYPVITVGEWVENTFINTWMGITFELPADFEVKDLSDIGQPPGQIYDFWLLHEDQKTNIMLLYVDLQSGDPRDHSAEDYLDITKEQLKNSPNRDYEFAERLDSRFIAGVSYRVLRTTFTDKNNQSGENGFQDGYARRYGNAIIVFLAVYDNDTKDSVDAFFSSISQI